MVLDGRLIDEDINAVNANTADIEKDMMYLNVPSASCDTKEIKLTLPKEFIVITGHTSNTKIETNEIQPAIILIGLRFALVLLRLTRFGLCRSKDVASATAPITEIIHSNSI